MKACLITTAFFLSIFNFTEAQISVTSNVDDCLCGGPPQKAFSVIAEGAAGPFSFRWAGPYNYVSEYKEPIDVREPGLYTLFVTNIYDCTFSYNIEIPACPSLNLFPEAITPATCPEAANGIVALSAEGGAPPYTVTWSDGVTGLYRSALAAGDYEATVTDANGCTASTAFTIPALPGITLDAVVTPLQCAEGPDGAVSLTVHGESGPVSYSWAGPEYPIGVNGSQAAGLSAGEYCVTVTDIAGCQASGCWEVEIGEVVYPPYLSRVEVFVKVGGVYQPVYRAKWLPNSQGCLKYVKDESVEISDEALDALANDAPVLVTVVSSQPLSSITLELLGAGLSLGGSEIQAGTGWVFEFTANTSQILNGGIVNQRLSFSGKGAGPQQYYLLNMNGYLDNTLGCAVLPEIQPDCSWEPGFVRGGDQSHLLQRLCSIEANLLATVINSEEGGCSGSIQMEIRGMTPPFEILLEGSGESIHFEGNSQVYPFEGLCPGEYHIEVIDANGCTLLLQEKVEECAPFIAKPVIVHSTNCDEEEGDGSITYTPESILNGTPPYSFEWSNGGTGSAISGMSPGMYSVTITDSRGCRSVFSHIISMDSEPGLADLLVEIVEVQPDANGDCTGSITVNIYYTGSPDIIFQVTGGGIYESMTLYTIAWPFDENVVLENLCAGTYNISVLPNVFPGNGSYCRIELEAEVLSCPGFEMGASPAIVRPENCNADNGSISYGEESPSGGTPPYLWMWSTGETSPYAIEGLSPGTYSLTVVDDNGCMIEKTFGLTVPSDAGLLAVAAFEQPTEGGCNGSITVSGVAGTEVTLRDQNGNVVAGPVQLSSDTYTFSNLCPASPYYITAKDGSMCLSTIQQSLTGCNELTLPFLEITGPSDCEAEDGLIRMVSPSGGGVPPYDYVLFDESGNSYDLPWEGLAQGLYTLIVSDATGCESKHEIELVSEASPQIILDYVKDECEDEMNGAIYLAISTGIGANEYSYTLIDETTGEEEFIPFESGLGIFEGLSTGNYTIIITALETGCTLERNYFVDEIISRGDFQLSGDGYTVQKSCPEQNTGEVTFHITGGNPPYTMRLIGSSGGSYYSYSKTTDANLPPGVVDVNFNGLPPGDYEIYYITDFCDRQISFGGPGEFDRNFNIGTFPEMDYDYTVDVDCPGESSVDLTVTGGNPPYSYEWNNGNTNQDIYNLYAGDYIVTVTDEETCYQSFEVVVANLAPPEVAVEKPIPYACVSYDIGQLRIEDISGGKPPYSFQWSAPGSDNEYELSGLPESDYYLTVTDGCGEHEYGPYSIGHRTITTSGFFGSCFNQVLCGDFLVNVDDPYIPGSPPYEIIFDADCSYKIECDNGEVLGYLYGNWGDPGYDSGEDDDGNCYCHKVERCVAQGELIDMVTVTTLDESQTLFFTEHVSVPSSAFGERIVENAYDEITLGDPGGFGENDCPVNLRFFEQFCGDLELSYCDTCIAGAEFKPVDPNIAVLGYSDDPVNEIVVYPNPVSNKVYIKLQDKTENAIWCTFADLIGRTEETIRIEQSEEGAFVFDIDQKFPPGLYYLRLKLSDGSSFSFKLLKM